MGTTYKIGQKFNRKIEDSDVTEEYILCNIQPDYNICALICCKSPKKGAVGNLFLPYSDYAKGVPVRNENTIESYEFEEIANWKPDDFELLED
jgi:hypothetical protein